MSELPNGWAIVALPHVAVVLDTRRIPLNADERTQRNAGKAADSLVPYYGATGQVGWIDEALFDENLVLLGEDGAPFLDPQKPKAYRVAGKSWVNNHAHVLRAREGVLDWRLLERQLNTIDYTGYVTGTTRLKLTQGAMNTLPILVPPFQEQTRIANQLDTLLTRVQACNDRFDAIPALLKRFRQTVLDAATFGALGVGHMPAKGEEEQEAARVFYVGGDAGDAEVGNYGEWKHPVWAEAGVTMFAGLQDLNPRSSFTRWGWEVWDEVLSMSSTNTHSAFADRYHPIEYKHLSASHMALKWTEIKL